MNDNLPKEIAALKPAMGVTEKGPIVSFFDHAEPDKEATKTSGRPRFRDVTYVRFQTRDDVTRPVFCCKALQEHKDEHPREWAHYCERKKGIENRAPILWAIPGMTRAKFEELRAIGLNDCEKLADYEGDLEQLAPLQEVAIKIMEISDEGIERVQQRSRQDRTSGPDGPVYAGARDHERGARAEDIQKGEANESGALRAGREAVHSSPNGRVHERRAVPGGGANTFRGDNGQGPLDELRSVGALSSQNSQGNPVQAQRTGKQDRLLYTRQLDPTSFDIEVEI